MNKNSSDLIELGELIKPHGLNGEIKLFLYNKKSDILKKGVKVCLERESVLSYLKIEYLKDFNKYKLIKFCSVDNRTNAESFNQCKIFLSRKEFPELEKGNFYLVDVLNFDVVDDNNCNYGKIIDVIILPTNNSILIDYNGKEIIIPIIEEFVKLFDFDNKTVILKNIEGFLK